MATIRIGYLSSFILILCLISDLSATTDSSTSENPTSSTTDITTDTSATTDPVSTSTDPSTTADTATTTDVSPKTDITTSTDSSATTVPVLTSTDSSTTAETARTTDLSATTDTSTSLSSTITSENPTSPTTDITTSQDPVSNSTDPSTTADPALTTVAVTTRVPVISTVNVTTGTSATPSTTKTSTTKTPPVIPIKCKNGGTPFPNNEGCYCTTSFTGITCDTAVTEILPEKIERPVSVLVDVSEVFDPMFDNQQSTEYKGFVVKFKSRMEPYYNKSIKFFAHVKVINLSKGRPITNRRRMRSLSAKEEKLSVNVRHDVILAVPYKENTDEDYKSAFENVTDALQALEDGTADVNININSFTANETKLDDKDRCKWTIDLLPEAYRQYYATAILDGKVMCVNQCHQGHPHPQKCSNDGTCEVSSQGLSCYCRHTDVAWYLGADCSYEVNKIGLYAGIGVVAVIAVMTVAVLTVYLVINQKKVKRSKDIKQDLVKEWLEDDFEWPQQKNTNSVGRAPHDNPAYSQGDFYRRDSMGEYRQDVSAGRTYTQYSTPEPGIQLQYFHGNVKIDRPQIRSSFEI